MKMKIIVILIFFTLILLLSYSKMNKYEINYTILGDKDLFTNNIISKNFTDLIYEELKKEDNFGFYCEDFIDNNLRITDVINQIEDNKIKNDLHIQNILKRTNLLILNIGNNELYYKLSLNENINEKEIYNYLDEVINDYIRLINILKKYTDNIFILGFYNNTNNKSNDKYYSYINNKLKESLKNYVIYIGLFDLLNKNNDYITKTIPIYITNEGNLALFNKIYTKIDKLYLHKNY